MKEIKNRKDIELLVNTFYKAARKDPVIQHFFNDVVDIDWDRHMPTMYDFWESILLDNPIYKGNPMTKHIALDAKSRMTPDHFDRWEELFIDTLESHFTGDKVKLAKKRVNDIKGLMIFKVQQARNS